MELVPPTPEEIQQYHLWWDALSPAWQQAFNETLLRRTGTERLPDDALHAVWNAPALRFAGPTASFPNMSFELENLDGLLALPRVEILVVIHHQIASLEAIGALPQLRSLFLHNNFLHSLQGIQALTGLQELYVNCNQISSLQPLENLTQLHTLYCNYNALTSLEGIGRQHLGTLKNFFCLPNDHLPDTEVLRMEQEVRLRCRQG